MPPLDTDEPDLQPLFAALAGRTRVASRLFLLMGLMCLDTEGAAGQIVINIPRDPSAFVDVEFVALNRPKEFR